MCGVCDCVCVCACASVCEWVGCVGGCVLPVSNSAYSDLHSVCLTSGGLAVIFWSSDLHKLFFFFLFHFRRRGLY